MKGICNIKVLRNGKEVNSITKQNVIFDIPKLMLQEYFDNIAIIGPNLNGNSTDILPHTDALRGEMFQGIRIYDENISTEDPKDVRVPVLSAGPIRNVSAPAEYAQSSFSSSNSEYITQATWSLNKDITIKSLGLCNKNVAESPSKIHLGGVGWNNLDGNNRRTSPGKYIDANNLLIEASRYGSWQGSDRTPMLLHKIENSLVRMTSLFGAESGTLGIAFGVMGSDETRKCHTLINPEKTKIYTIRNTKIAVYDIATKTMDKEYTITTGRYGSVLFGETRDVWVEAQGTTVRFYDLSRADNTMTLITTITAPVSLTIPYHVNNRYIVFKEGYIVGAPSTIDNSVKSFYSFENTTGYNQSFSLSSMTIPIVISMENYANYADPILPNSLSGNAIRAACWFNTTALNFDTPIELLNGDTFVVTYKITV